MNAPDPSSRLPTAMLGALLGVLAAVMAPHAVRLPLWLTALVVTTGLWRWLIASRGSTLPPRPLRLLLTLAAAGAVLAQYGTIAGRDPGVAMLVLMTALKLLETRSRRDTIVLLYLAYFIVATQFLYSQSVLVALYMAGITWATTTLLIAVNRPTGAGLARDQARPALALLLQAVPVMVLLFVLFPRLPGPLWSMPEGGDTSSGTSGLSDEMTPGSISSLSQSDAVAFRVEMEGEPPSSAGLYWRGPVLAAYDGRTWQRRKETGTDSPAMEPQGPPAEYTVTLEPHNQHWLLALDLPGSVPANAEMTAGNSLRADEPVRSLRRYRVRSHTDYRLQPELSPELRAFHTRLPAEAHPRARELAERWHRQSRSASEVVERALRRFREQPFVYTLTPPLLTGDSVDEFLFETRRGFCEHYAGAFVVLMRAADIPARVVTGYLGGEPVGDHLTIRQSDAHAWAEVWLPGEGWQRVDPTAAVAPDRVENGIGSAVPAGDPLPSMARPEASWTRELRLAWDRIDAGWDRWVLGYGPEMQSRLLELLGLDRWWGNAVALAGGLAAALLLAAAVAFWPRRKGPADPVQRSWERFCRKMARAGLPRRPGEGPLDYARRIAAARPDLSRSVYGIARLYASMRYGRHAHRRRREVLRHRIRGFRPESGL